MGYIKEPKGVNFVVAPSPLTEQDRQLISGVIAHYKTTGQKKERRKGKHPAPVKRGRKAL
jgi:alpha-ketoglutarate-dependent taurine dioxygenase